MKKIWISFAGALLCTILITAAGVSAQTTQPEQKKVAYNFINEYGFFIGKKVGFSSVFINGVKIKNSDAIGIGVGYGAYISEVGGVQEVPMFLNYRHYFNRGQKLTPLINIGLGASAHFWDEDIRENLPVFVNGDIDHYEWMWRTDHRHGFGLYGTVASGFTFRALSFTAGLFFRTLPSSGDFCGGIEAKIGYTF